MKATELMIGDWVYNSYHKKNIKWNYSEMFCPNGIPVIGRDLEPIPLTPEILEKNGFSSETFLTDEWGRQVYFKEFPSCVVEPDDSGKYIFGTITYWNKTDGDGSPIDWGTMYESRIHNLQYVHELQRALRCCGLWDIADNFVV